jgi:hypothetical protein
MDIRDKALFSALAYSWGACLRGYSAESSGLLREERGTLALPRRKGRQNS